MISGRWSASRRQRNAPPAQDESSGARHWGKRRRCRNGSTGEFATSRTSKAVIWAVGTKPSPQTALPEPRHDRTEGDRRSNDARRLWRRFLNGSDPLNRSAEVFLRRLRRDDPHGNGNRLLSLSCTLRAVGGMDDDGRLACHGATVGRSLDSKSRPRQARRTGSGAAGSTLGSSHYRVMLACAGLPGHTKAAEGMPMTLLRDFVVAALLALLISAVGSVWINLEIAEVWPAWLEPWSK